MLWKWIVVNAVSESRIAVEDILDSLEEILADEKDVLGPLRDTIPPNPWPSVLPPPKAAWPSLRKLPPPLPKAAVVEPALGGWWPVAICGIVAVVATAAAILASPLVGRAGVQKAAVAIHARVF